MASSTNKVILVGRLGQDPKLTYLPSGAAVAELSVATDESYKNREGQKVEQTEWHRVKLFGHSAEFAGKYLGKGQLVYVEGQLRTRSWEDQQGQKRYVTEVVVSAPGHCINGLDRGQDRQGEPRGQGQQQRQDQGQQRQGGFPSEATGMDDVPFVFMIAGPALALALAALQGLGFA